MPNTLGHFGIQGVATRLVLRDADPKWIYAGCIVPDLPWIVRRAVIGLAPGVDPFAVTYYAAAQASLLGAALLSGALALLARRPGLVFVVLGFNALLHLLLDALQTKWGNGVSLLAPFSFEVWNAGWFWPESWWTHALTLGGLAFFLWAWVRRPGTPVPLRLPPPRAALGAAALLALYALGPLAFVDDVERARSHSLGELRRPTAGDEVVFDRFRYVHRDDAPDLIRTWAGQEFVVRGAALDRSTQVSLVGRFEDERTLFIEKLHDHGPFSRNLPTYAGLALFAAQWLRSWLRRGAPART